MEIDLKTFLAWLCLTNALKMSKTKYQAGFGVIIWGQNHLTFTIPINYYTIWYENMNKMTNFSLD